MANRPMPRRWGIVFVVAALAGVAAISWMGPKVLAYGGGFAPGEVLPGTQRLEMKGDLAAQMVEGMDRFLMRELAASVERRARHWKRDFSSSEAYAKSVEPNRQRLRKIIGLVDPRVSPVEMELVGTTAQPSLVAETDKYQVHTVRWTVFPGVDGEGLLLEPKGKPPVAQIVAIPDADWSPEMLVGLSSSLPLQGGAGGVPSESQFARRLAEAGCRVLVPVLIDRNDTWSGNAYLGRFTNQPHREFIYRQAFEMGRNIIGFEVQKVLAAVDWFSAENKRLGGDVRIGVAGYGEGGLLALYSAALDERIDATLVSGYFQPREDLWKEPIYRNVWALRDEFGDAELASLVAPRGLVVEACQTPQISGPPAPRQGRSGAAPGVLATPALESVKAEFERGHAFYPMQEVQKRPKMVLVPNCSLVVSGNGEGPPGSQGAVTRLLAALGIKVPSDASADATPTDRRGNFDPTPRLKRQFDQLVEYTQHLMRQGEFRRAEFWSKVTPNAETVHFTPEKGKPVDLAKWREACQPYRDYLWEEVIGKFPPASLPPNPRTRLIYDTPKYTGYEVVLDVYPDVFAYGILLLPKDLKPGERRPVVVCQHGLEGRPQDTIQTDVDGFRYYKAFSAKLAERGFIVYAPQNPYIGQDKFRVLQRKANPLKKSLFAFIVRQHERTLDWLAGLPYVDPERIGFYGLSYGGKTAVRVPPLLDRYCLSICSADYNEWIWKNTTTSHRFSYLYTGEYEMFEFDLGNTFNYANLAGLMAPRPFMVERGHNDGVAPTEWVAYEYAKVGRLYAFLGIPERTEIEFFNGPHEINGDGTFDFLHRHLNWPKPAAAGSGQ